MGSGFSSTKELKCPEGYDKSKFEKILKLYDKLDNNGNMAIEEDEICILSIHHIKNRIMLLENDKLENKNNMENNILSLKLEYEKNKKKLVLDYGRNIKEYCQSKENKDLFIDKKLENLKKLTKVERYELFKKRFAKGDDKINFPLFFEYMKDKTSDIENINWKSTGKLDYLDVNKKVSVYINSPNGRPRKLSSP